ncbi:heme-binding domain-containing protein [Tenacibaculum sp. 190524A02b]|uniref:Haem-binding domain-containing protein n=1 Tax=Tenacibaculum vairaonense TaxID=3137860 RepID=A0ABM9PNJ4_9FLAO
MKTIKRVAGVVLVVLIISQFFQPKQNEKGYVEVDEFLVQTKASENVKEILTKACFDCHTNKTQYPWYSKITPVNFWMAHHIEEGKEHLNFDTWNSYSLKRKEHKMEEIYEEVEEKHMPLKSYTLTHGDAKLTEEEVNLIVAWAKEAEGNYKKQLEN